MCDVEWRRRTSASWCAKSSGIRSSAATLLDPQTWYCELTGWLRSPLARRRNHEGRFARNDLVSMLAGSRAPCAALTVRRAAADIRFRRFWHRQPSYLHGHSGVCARVLAIQGSNADRWTATLIPDTVLLPLLADRARSGFPRGRLEVHVCAGPRGRNGGHQAGHAAAALTDGHVSHNADRLASTRARRAATARDIRSAGTASPVPKYIHPGVCPRRAECGSTWLCSWT